MWRIYGILVHLALITSIFVIYFRSPVITGLHRVHPIRNTPAAHRIVIFVTDGLRAESFFRNQCEDIPHIRKLIKTQGLLGISRTRVPTESRPGHIALLSGLYEDPSAVLRGWKSNPIDFDNIFNISSNSFAWGDGDIVGIFSKITNEEKLLVDAFESYDFSGAKKVTVVDDWVFERVRLFLNRKAKQLQGRQQIVFFLHLLGMDTAGHVHKPGTRLFREALHSTEKGVYEMYETFEKHFPDGKTTYILTSDHGMTNHGSHGDGSEYETDTPLYIWGAGINNWNRRKYTGKEYFEIDKLYIPLHQVEQIQLTPLMSSLIALAPPVNNFGILPIGFLNVSEKYEAQAVTVNTVQLLQQFELVLEQFNRGVFSSSLKGYQYLQVIENTKRDFYRSNQEHRYRDNTREGYAVMELVVDGIDYYQNYYRKLLLFCITVSVLIWLAYLLSLFVDVVPTTETVSYLNLGVTGALVGTLCFFQMVPIAVGFYVILPFCMWALVLQANNYRARWYNAFLTKEAAALALTLIIASTLLVASFFQRPYITLLFLFFTLHQSRSMQKEGVKFNTWIGLNVVICIFPLLPPAVGETNNFWLALGTILTLGRSFLVKSNLPKWIYAIAVVALINAWYCIIQHSNHQPTFLVCRLLCWLYVGYSLVLPFCIPYNNTKSQVELLFFNLTTSYLLFCTNYEAVLVILLGSQLMLTLSLTKKLPDDYFTTSPINDDLRHAFRLSWTILLYTFFLLFGTGNIASMSSFDPNVMRCFLSSFSRNIITGLVILKLLIPMLLNLIIIYGTVGRELKERHVYIMLLVICDWMGLYFLYLVRNKGSWMEIGSSISHFIIMQVTTWFLVAMMYVAKLYLRVVREGEKVK